MIRSMFKSNEDRNMTLLTDEDYSYPSYLISCLLLDFHHAHLTACRLSAVDRLPSGGACLVSFQAQSTGQT